MAHVTAVMVTGKREDRIPLAYAAIASFLLQTHVDSDLLIINDGPPLLCPDRMPAWLKTEQWLESAVDRLREKVLDKGCSLGALRNIGLSLATGDFICQWDDDDWSHCRRIELQLDRAKTTRTAVLLHRQVRCNLQSGTAFDFTWPYRDPPGIPGTILHPRVDSAYYRDLGRSEDDWFIRQHFPSPYVLKSQLEEPLYIRFYHGGNTWSADHIIGRHHADDGTCSLIRPAADYLRRVLKEFYPTYC